MKKSVALILAFAILSSLVLAGGSYDLRSFDTEPTQGIVVGAKDEVRFQLFDAMHTIVFDKVTDVGFRFTAYPYMKTEFKIPVGVATREFSSHIDIDQDGVSDIVIAFHGSEHDEETNETYATVIFKLEDNRITTQAVGAEDAGVIREKSYSRYLGPVGAIAFILILVLIARRTSRGKNEGKGEKAEVTAGEEESGEDTQE